MTNISTFFRASVWMAVAATLMLAALEPVQIDPSPTQIAAVTIYYAAA